MLFPILAEVQASQDRRTDAVPESILIGHIEYEPTVRDSGAEAETEEIIGTSLGW